MINIVIRRLLLAVVLLGSVGCAPTVPVRPAPTPDSQRPPAEFPRAASEQSGPAVLALLAQADAELRAGANARAIAKLENALRIESRNPFVWQRLAQANLQEGRADQAEALALRSISLARGNPWVAMESWKLVAEARQARGDPAGAQAALEKVDEFQDRLDR